MRIITADLQGYVTDVAALGNNLAEFLRQSFNALITSKFAERSHRAAW